VEKAAASVKVPTDSGCDIIAAEKSDRSNPDRANHTALASSLSTLSALSKIEKTKKIRILRVAMVDCLKISLNAVEVLGNQDTRTLILALVASG
jgi:hypothetical protein